jgi:hypothetical protein
VQVGCAPMGRLRPLIRRMRALACPAQTRRRFVAVARYLAALLRVARKHTRLAADRPARRNSF